MDQKIGIHFGTTYDGKGSRQLQNGINQAGGAIARLKNSIKTMGSGIGSALKTVGSNLMNIKAGFDMLIGVVSKVGQVIKNAFDISRLENNFKFLIGSVDEARRHMNMLYELGRTPPFSMKEFAAASKSMMVLSENALGGKESLIMIGDAADGVGVPIETMAESIGYLYAMIRDGQPITRATKQLVRMGAISPEVASKMETMQKQGESLSDIWETLTTALTKFTGAMDMTSESTGGKIEIMKSRFEEFINSITVSFADGFESQMGKINDSLDSVANNSNWGKLANQIGRITGKLMDKGATLASNVAGVASNVLGFAGVKTTPEFNSHQNEALKNKIEELKKPEDPVIKLNKVEWGNLNKAIEKTIKSLNELGYNYTSDDVKNLRDMKSKALEGMNIGSKPEGVKIMMEDLKSMVDSWSGIKKASEKLTVDQEKIATNNRRAVEEEMRAQEEVANKESKDYYNQEMESRENMRNTLLTQIRNRLENIHDQQKKQKFYIDASKGGNDGINDWGKGNRPTDENGNFLRPEHAAEAERDAGRGERNINSQRIGPNRLAAMQKDYNDLKNKIAKNPAGVEGLDDRDRKRFRTLDKFFNPEEPKLKDAADQIKKHDLTQINNTLGNIKTMLEQSLNIK